MRSRSAGCTPGKTLAKPLRCSARTFTSLRAPELDGVISNCEIPAGSVPVGADGDVVGPSSIKT
jgi:hypothetical protein